MTAPLTDDDLGARLRAALQQVSPLATDPVPTPRFAPDTVAALAPVGRDDGGELVELGRAERPSGRRRWVGVGAVIGLAAAAVVAAVLVTDRPGGDGVDAPAAVASTPPRHVPLVLKPPAGALATGADVWRCTAPAGTTIAAVLQSDRIYHDQVWAVAAGTSCSARPDEAGKYQLDRFGVTVPGASPAFVGTTGTCVTAGTSFSDVPHADLSVPSRGSSSYLEFFGPGCYLLLPSR